jgi:hypothetical protein
LEDQDIDDTTGIIIDIDKRLVDASQAKVIAAALRLPQEEDVPESAWFTEIKALDKWHSILIASRVDPSTIPELETWNETAGFSLPNKLIEAGIIWDSKLDTDAGASGVTDAASVEANDLSWSVSAEAVVSGSLTGRPYTLVENGRSGSGQVTVERTYSYGPPLDNIVAHEFKPCYGTISLRGAQGYHKASGQQSGKGSIRVGDALNYRRQYDTDLAITQFGPVEAPTTPSLQFKGDHAVASPIISTTQTATTGTLPGTGYYPVAIASLSLEAVATLEWPGSSVPLGSGDSYILKVDVRPWRFGWWVKEVYTLTIPGATPP